MLKLVLCVVIGYICGCISTGYFVGKANGIDIRKSGSGNIGTTNALRTLGIKAGILTFIGDLAKVLLPVILIMLFLPSENSDYMYLYGLYTGLGAVLGHNFPFWLDFKGGKGIAVTSGVIIALTNWQTVVFGLLLFIIIVAITRYVSLGSLIVALYLPIFIAITKHGSPMFIHMLIISLLFTALAYYKHAANINRLLHGTENKLGSKNRER